jgi:hypothetical protein
MDLIPEIKLRIGFGDLLFFSTTTEAEKVFGKPEEIQVLDDSILETSCTVYHYWDKGFSLFFDNKNLKKMSSVEVDNRDSLLFNLKIFSLNEKQLIELLNTNGFKLSDTEKQDWGEKRVSFDDAGLDCYFENDKLVSLNFGSIDETTLFNYSPN